MLAADVFPYSSYPEYTYVERESKAVEDELKDVLLQKGAIVSIAGPSKTGKSAVVERVIREDEFLKTQSRVHPSEVEKTSDIWEKALANIDTPTKTEKHITDTEQTEHSGNAGVDVGVTLGGEKRQVSASTETDVSVDERQGVNRLVDEVDLRQYVLTIEDFHLYSDEMQEKVAQAIKAGSEKGLSICVTLVSYKPENLEEVYGDLADRVYGVQIDYWEDKYLREIAENGFEQLNVDINESMINDIISEAGGSPQLMQILCFSICRHYGIRQKRKDNISIGYDDTDYHDLYGIAIKTAGFTEVVRKMDQGAITRGRSRNKYKLISDNSIKNGSDEGDYYRCCLRAIASDPPRFTLTTEDMLDRVKQQCQDDHPKKRQITDFCSQIEGIANEQRPTENIVIWDDEEGVINIRQPGLLFNIRWSVRLGLESI